MLNCIYLFDLYHFEHLDGAVCLNLSSWKSRTHLTYTDITMTADGIDTNDRCLENITQCEKKTEQNKIKDYKKSSVSHISP